MSEPEGDVTQRTAPTYRPMGDGALLIDFAPDVARAVAPEVNRRVRALAAALDADPPAGLLDLIPAYDTLLVVYDPLAITYDALRQRLSALDASSQSAEVPARRVTIPVVYGGEFGPDLPAVATHTGLSTDEVVARHTAGQYLVYFLGFSPGFPYLGGLDPTLATPRLAEPRVRVSAGSVGIAGTQTGVYPEATPGGWQLIGRTPLRLYDPTAAEPFLLRAGDKLRFRAIDADEFARIEAAVADRVQAASERGNMAAASTGSHFRVLSPGLLTTVQDLGRYGYERFGLGAAGALDDYALRWANLLTGNPPEAAALEVTLLGPTLVYEGDAPLIAALAGADCGATLNDCPLDLWRGFCLEAGDTLTLGACQQGARTYLAIRGGIAVVPVFGSRSTDLLGHIGGIEGRALRAGDLVPLRALASTATEPAGAEASLRALPDELIPRYEDQLSVRVVLGPQHERFTDEALSTFLAATYTVTPQMDRMGMRLAGPILAFRPDTPGADILSEGIVTGAIQVPAHGQPIILLAGHQTTGGYAKIATVIGADLWRLGQARPGSRIRFQAISLEEAHEARRAYLANFDPARLVALAALATDAHPNVSPALPRASWSAQHVDELLARAGSLGIGEGGLLSEE